MYAVDPDDLTNWTYLGPLATPGLNFRPSRWSGDLGKNWEVTNFVTLRSGEKKPVSRDFVVMGAEGCIPTSEDELQDGEIMSAEGSIPTSEDGFRNGKKPVKRTARAQLWISGPLEKITTDGEPDRAQMTPSFGGYLDHGSLYAANSFFDPISEKQIFWGWIPEEDLADELRYRQGWSGMLSLPREIRLQTIQRVARAWSSNLHDITSVEVEKDAERTATIRTLANLPVQSVVEQLRRKPRVRKLRIGNRTLNCGSRGRDFSAAELKTQHWELDCSFRVSKACRSVGVTIGSASDSNRTTSLSFTPDSETFIITRPSLPVSNSSCLINSRPETAPHTLFTTRDPLTSEEETELLRIRAWRDNSVLEVFINDRTAITTRLYGATEGATEIRFWADEAVETSAPDGTAPATELVEAVIWDGIGIGN